MKCNHSPIGSKLKKEVYCKLDKGHADSHWSEPENELVYSWVEDSFIQVIDARGPEDHWGELALMPYK